VAEIFKLHQQSSPVIGSIRRKCLDHIIIFNEHYLRSVLKYIRLKRGAGELMPTPLSPVLDVDALVAMARQKCLDFFNI